MDNNKSNYSLQGLPTIECSLNNDCKAFIQSCLRKYEDILQRCPVYFTNRSVHRGAGLLPSLRFSVGPPGILPPAESESCPPPP